MSDSLERRIVDKLIESFETPYPKSHKVNEELLRMIAKYKACIGEDSWMQRQYNAGKQV
tara:strand:+ start:249 stop:425 length:177 start_codon:yes stop_codon:yes gene_type:complete